MINVTILFSSGLGLALPEPAIIMTLQSLQSTLQKAEEKLFGKVTVKKEDVFIQYLPQNNAITYSLRPNRDTITSCYHPKMTINLSNVCSIGCLLEKYNL